MRLTLHTDYALRVLIHVAIADGKLITISDIAESFDISKQHLMKVANNLSRKGYLDTVRGRGGGMRLRRPPRDINIGQVVRETEDKLDVIGGLGRIYTGRSDQAAEGVVVVAARSACGTWLIADSPPQSLDRLHPVRLTFLQLCSRLPTSDGVRLAPNAAPPHTPSWNHPGVVRD